MTNRQQHRTMIEERRQQRTNRRRLLEVLGLMVILVTAYALMVPAISITQDAATQEKGFYQAEQAEIQNIMTESESVSGEFAASGGQDDGESQDAGEQGGAESADPSGQDVEPAGAGEEPAESGAATGEGPAAEDAAAEEAATGAQDERPAQEFREELKDAYGNVTMAVSVKAPKGAFAAGTTMRISEIDAEEVKAEVEAAVQKTSGANTAVKQMAAVDIVFLDAEDNEVEPARQVEVKITSEKVREIDDPVLVHVVDKGKPAQASKPDDAEVVKRVEVVNEDDADKTVGTEDTLKFKTKEFSPYVIVETETIEANVLASDGNTYTVTVTYGPDANIPAGAELDVREIVQGNDTTDEATEYEEYLEKTQEALGLESGAFEHARFFDIKIVNENGEKVEIAAPVDVKIELADTENGEEAEDTTRVVHFADGSENGDVVEVTTEAAETGQAVSFEAEGFSVYAIVKGPSEIPVWWGKAAKVDEAIQKGAEGTDGSGGFYIGQTSGFYLKNSTSTTESSGTKRTGIEKTKPAKIAPPVAEEDPTPAVVAAKYYFEKVEGTSNQVYIYCYNDNNEKQYVYHGPENNSLSYTDENNKTPFTIDVESGGKFVIHHTDTENKKWYWNMEGGQGGTRFCTSDKNDANCKLYFWYLKGNPVGDPYGLDNNEEYTLITWDGGQTGKAMTGEPNQDNEGNLCAEFLTVMTKKNNAKQQLFVPDDSKDEVTPWRFTWKHDDFYKLSAVLYTKDAEGNQVPAGTKYLKIANDGKLSMVDDEADASEIQAVPGTGIHEGQISLKCNGNTLTYSGEFAKGFDTNTGTGKEWLYLAKAGDEAQLKEDYYRTYSANKISVSDPSLTPLFDGDTKKIIIYTRVWNGSGYKYFAIDGNGKMVPCSESGNEIEWMGSGLDELQWKFTEYGTWTTVYQKDSEGNLILDSEGKPIPELLTDEDGNPIYETDEDGNPVYKTDENGEQILDEDGQPIKVQKIKQEISPSGYYELQNSYTNKYLAPLISNNQILSPDTIGLNLNGRSNGQYYTPVLAWDGGYYSYASIKAELDATQDAVIEPCVRVEGMDLYFAIINELDVDDTIHTVPTVDNNMYGITMRMANYKTRIQGESCDTSQEQTTVLGNKKYDKNGQTPNLLSTKLDANGYPTARITGRSLADLYTAKGDGTGQADYVGDVNHLFVESTYKATGYYEYDSAQNYAYLEGGTSGDFTVYQEIGTHDSSNKNTLKHGQFFPYNKILPGVFATTNGRNTYTTTATPLPSTDPRYNEQLYLLQRNTYQPDYPADYWFGAELTASFYQTPSGLDAWGHDIIFEFSGDDDFWLYVDGELVIDLGGIHSALPASVNFRTGKVNVNGTATTLLDLFVNNKVTRGECADTDEARAQAKADLVYDPSVPGASPAGKTFVKKVVDGETQYTFIDNTNHTMRIFYMERGAGASNLHMKFNLAAVEKGTVQLSKELDVDGEDMSDSVYATFPYQIWYKDPLYNEENPVSGHTVKYVQLTEQTLGNHGSVKYLGSTNEVTYKPEIYVDNSYRVTEGEGDEQEIKEVNCSVKYEGVYLVDPGETIVITFPIFGETGEEQYVTEYKIVECGVDPNIYCSGEGGTESGVTLDDGTVVEPIKVNTNIRVTGWNYDDEGNPTTPKIEEIEEVYSGLCNYEIEYASLDNRSKVKYKNNVPKTEELLIQKNLYKKEGNQISLIQKSDLYYENGDPKDPDNPDLKTTYDFRVSFKTPYDSDYTSANVYPYHVKDAGGYYCKWHPADASSANPNEEGSQGYFKRITNEAYPNGISDFNLLTDDTVVDGVVTERGEKFQATFDTSIYGSVSQIPAYYTVELHGLIPGTEFKVVERPTETPDGYEFYRYELDGKAVYPMTNVSQGDDLVTAENFASRRSTLFVEEEHGEYGGYRPLADEDVFQTNVTYYEIDPWLGVEGSITKDKESEVLVDNYKGFALRLYKNWTDAKTMKDRKPAYFAVFYETTDPETGELVRKLVNTDDAVRQLAYKDNPQELYWFYMHLPPVNGMAEGGLNFENYVVREVQLTGDFTVDKHGVVSGYEASGITVIENGGVIEIAGTQNIQGAQETKIPYKVTYTKTQTVGTSLRKFWVTDKPSDKPAVKFLKEDWSDHPLAGAGFTLKQGANTIFANQASVIEQENPGEALISIEHLTEYKDYVLTETFAPQGYYGLQQALTFQLVPDSASSHGWTLNVTPNTVDITDYYEFGFEQVTNANGQVTDEYVTLTIKNRPYDFKVIKEDAVDHTKLKDIQFEIYKFIPREGGGGGGWSTTPEMWNGSSILKTSNEGVIPHLDNTLPAGIYQLREKNAASGYDKIGDIDFSVSAMGVITLLPSHPSNVTLVGPTEVTDDQTGKLVYTMTVPNTPKPLKLKKVNESSQPLTGAKFRLMKKREGQTSAGGDPIWDSVNDSLSGYNGPDYSTIDMTAKSEIEFFSLPVGLYRLEETDAPPGYVITDQPCFYFRIKTDRSVELCKEDGSKASNPYGLVSLGGDKTNGYTITVKNTPGVALPVTGGLGTDFMYILGTILIVFSGASLVMKKKRKA